jgi:hypothetical protein
MTTAVAIRAIQLPLLPGFTSMGFRPPAKMTLKQWSTAVKALSFYGKAISWAVGDIVSYGEDIFPEEHSQYLEEFLTSYDHTKVSQCANVARKFPMTERHEKLSFSHHVAVMSLDLPAAHKWLNKAEKEGWGNRELRAALKGDPDEDGAKAPNLVVVKDGDEILEISARIASLKVKSEDKSTISLVIGSRAFEIVGSSVSITESEDSDDKE